MSNAIVFDCEGARLSDDERAFFREADPFGFILFARHCETAENIRAHCDELRDCIGRDVMILIDQEGGRVTRMKPPIFREHVAPGVIGELWRLDPNKALEAAQLNAKLLGRMVSDLGVNVNCIPSLDAPQIDSDPATLGDRAFARHRDTIASLGRAAVNGSIEGGALPVIKHMPGLGRALCDSHHDLPKVTAKREDLEAEDFPPFKALNEAPLGMTAHVVYDALDAERPATQSPYIINEVIRGEIGFDGLLFTDDLKMQALSGDYDERVATTLAAGCDIALVCNISLAEKQTAMKGVKPLTDAATARSARAFNMLNEPDRSDTREDYAVLEALLKPVMA